MNSGTDYLLGQLLSIVFYMMTLVIYNRARREYVGGKIADAINLIMIFLAILLVADTTDYFITVFLSVGDDTKLIIKILLKLFALSVLFFGGLRFFSKRSISIPGETRFPPTDGAGLLPSIPGQADSFPDGVDTADMGALATKAKPTLGRYEIIEQIGKGAMGVVYKGLDPKLQRMTAIKTIRFIDDYDEEKVEKVKSHFYHEAEVVARLSHRNIVKIYDVGEDLDLSYLAMEYLEGTSLERYCREDARPSISQSIDIVAQVCDALDYAHSHGIIHRDIKPGNIMLLKNGDVKVTDFGIARAAGSTKTRTGIIKGTPYYMSPEQARGKNLDGSADIFSLGVVFYQILSGRLPFTGENLSAIMYQTANTEPVPPSTYNPEITQALENILNQALAKNPEARYQTAGQMGEELRRFQKDMLPEDTASGVSDDLRQLVTSATTGSPVLPDEKATAGQGVTDSLDFTDLDQVLTLDSGVQKERRHTGSSGYQDGQMPAGDDRTRRIDLSDLPGSPGGASPEAGKHSATDPDGRKRKPEDAPSYQVVKTIPVSPQGGRRTSGTPAAGMSGLKTLLTRRFIKFVIAGALVSTLLGTGYYLFWSSPQAEKGFFKSAFTRMFQSEDEIRKEQRANQEKLVKKIMQEKLLEKQREASAEKQKQQTFEEQQKSAEDLKQQQQRIVQQKLEDARKKQEAERLARIEAQKQKEQARLESERIAKEKEQKRLAALAAAEKAEARRLAEKARKEADAKRLDDLTAVESLMQGAAAHLQARKYLQAKHAYQDALEAISASPFKSDSKMDGYRRDIESILSTDDIVYGSKGYVQYKGEWLTPEALEMKRYSEGFVKYKGEFIDHKTLMGTIKTLCAPLVQIYLASKYSGQTVHSKNINFQKAILIRNNARFSEYSVYHRWEVWTFQGKDEDMCIADIRYTVENDKWSLIKGCE